MANQSRPVTAPPYRDEVNEVLVAWLMTAPDVPDERLTLDGCLVRDECYRFALDDPDLMGFWAGFTAKERRAIRRARVA